MTADLSPELADLADGDPTRLGWLALAEEWYDADAIEGARVTGRALNLLAGTWGHKLGAWTDLRDAVTRWHAWDLVTDHQGRTDYLNIGSRETVCSDVVWTLDRIAQQAVSGAA